MAIACRKLASPRHRVIAHTLAISGPGHGKSGRAIGGDAITNHVPY